MNIFKAPTVTRRSLTQFTNPTSNSSAFGPGTPAKPSPIGGEPRLWRYPTSFNMPSSPETYKAVSFEDLRKWADKYDLLRRCIEYRKDEITALEWQIVPKERRNKKVMREVQEKNADLIRDIENFFHYPEAYMTRMNGQFMRWGTKSYTDWLSALLEDLFVIDAIALYPRRKRMGDMLALERVDGATIKLLLDDSGRVPTGDATAYQQYIWGYVRENFKESELVYRVYTPRNNSPYGYSLVEQILNHVKMAINNEKFISSYFSDGSIPETLFTVPESWDVQTMMDFAAIMNARLSGNPKALREFNVLPESSKAIQLRPFEWDDKFVNYVACTTAILCGIQPQILGLNNVDSGLGGKGFSEQARQIHNESSAFLARWLQNLFTEIIEKYFGADASQLSFCFTHLLEKEERERAEINDVLIKSGQKSIDQVLVENGEQPEGVSRFYVAGDRIYFTPDLVAGSVKGSVAVNLGAIGGVKMPDDTFTEDVPLTQDAPGAGVVTPNPNQAKDPTAKLDTSDKEPPDENKSKPAQPPRAKASTPNAPTINTAKSLFADVHKAAGDSGDSDSRKRDTHEFELAFIAAFYKLFGRIAYTSAMLNPQIALSAFALTQSQRMALSNLLYTLKRDVYMASYEAYAREHGLSPISNIDARTDAQLRTSVAKSLDSIVNTYADDLRAEFATLTQSSVTDVHDIVDRLNEWRKQRNRFKADQIATTEISEPWNRAVFDIDQRLGITDEREYWVQPGQGVCANCQAMIADNPYTFDEAQSLQIPNHPGCVHTIVSRARR